MSTLDARRETPDRRRVPRGGRRTADRPGRYPPLLIAESYEGVRKTCSRYLQQFHFQVVQAATGEEALARIVAEPPHLILAEVNLPSMPAGRLAQWLAQSWRTRHIPVIAMAGGIDRTGSPDELPGLVAGVLQKPFPLRVMLDEIRRVLRATETRGGAG
jgi:DNA-binding response OmpR family regulator